MRIRTGVIGVIALLGLFAGFAISQNDPGMQQSDTSTSQQQMKQQRAMTNDPQTVKQIQQALIDKGYYSGPVDGKWNSKTEDALRLFQSAQGMQANGQLDQQTLASLGVSGGAAAGGQQDMSSSQPSGGSGQQSGQMGGNQQGGSKY